MAAKKTIKRSSKIKKLTSEVPAKSIKAVPARQTKMQILKAIAKATDLALKDVRNVFLTANLVMQSHIIKRGSGEFSIPEMAIKIVRKTKAATKKRQGRNPLTGENITIPAKPKREIIKIRPLKGLKELLPN